MCETEGEAGESRGRGLQSLCKVKACGQLHLFMRVTPQYSGSSSALDTAGTESVFVTYT